MGGGNITGGLGATPVSYLDQGLRPQTPTSFCGFHIKKTLFLTYFYMEKGHAVSAVTTSVARNLQLGGGGGGLRMTLYTGADPENFCGVHVILN